MTPRATAIDGAVLNANLSSRAWFSGCPTLKIRTVLDLVVMAAESIGRTPLTGIVDRVQTTVATVGVAVDDDARLVLAATLGRFPVTLGIAHLEVVGIAAVHTGRALLFVRSTRATFTAIDKLVVGETVLLVGALLHRLPGTLSAAFLEVVVVVVAAVPTRRALLLGHSTRATGGAVEVLLVSETVLVFGAILDRVPVTMVAALLKGVVVAAARLG